MCENTAQDSIAKITRAEQSPRANHYDSSGIPHRKVIFRANLGRRHTRPVASRVGRVLVAALASEAARRRDADEDGTPVRLLNVNGTFQSASYLSDELWAELVCAYHRTMVDEIDRHGRVRSVLVIGGGGYSLPKYLIAHTKRMEVTVVEIDPKITQVARERFFLDRVEELAGERLVLVNADGWEYLRSCGRTFDVIVNDAFSGARPLGALGNAEGAALIRTHLSKRGMYLANVRTPLEGRKAKVLADVRDAFAREFGSVEVIPERPEEPEVLANNVLVARVEA